MTSPRDERVLLGLGSNLGDRRAHLARAVQRLDETPGIRVAAVSRIWVTSPWGGPDGQQDFFNAAVLVETVEWTPRRMLEHLLAIERESGRVRLERNGPRTLDLDILLFGDREIDEEGLTVPHRGMPDRSFVLGPAADIAADFMNPTVGRTVADMAADVGHVGVVSVLADAGWHRVVGHTQSC